MAERSAAPGLGNIFFCFWSGRAVKESGKKEKEKEITQAEQQTEQEQV